MYTYHAHPPFITGKNQGLTYDLADYLTGKSSERFVFVVMPMSRPHLNKAIELSILAGFAEEPGTTRRVRVAERDVSCGGKTSD
ncbi:MAG: hypothetical protein QNL90_14035 [Gammaproteobacteria bacterium]|nr:hypothetical protein [Gammaproteobacteria bacterium]MDX2461257.1 hypothetical protein [Gammaproteobacteria bacterium]